MNSRRFLKEADDRLKMAEERRSLKNGRHRKCDRKGHFLPFENILPDRNRISPSVLFANKR